MPPVPMIKKRQDAYLPHWTQAGATYSVMFRLADSLPASVVERWRFERENIVRTASQMNRPLLDQERKELARLHSEKIERFLDAGHGSCYLQQEKVAQVVAGALTHFEGKRYRLAAWCVMPNHVHVIVQPLPGHDLTAILHSWKSYTGKEANKLLKRTSQFWEPEYFDHLIRDEQELEQQVKYALQNPARAGLRNWKWVWAEPSLRPRASDL